MAHTYDHSVRDRTNRKTVRSAFGTFFAGLGEGFNAFAAARVRCAEIERLYAMSDKQLAAMGLTREAIPRHVFRDKLFM